MAKQYVQTYLGWKIYDNGPNYWPATGRFTSTKFGVEVHGGRLETVLNTIKDRCNRYPWEAREVPPSE